MVPGRGEPRLAAELPRALHFHHKGGFHGFRLLGGNGVRKAQLNWKKRCVPNALVLGEFDAQPGTSVGPPGVGGAGRDAEGIGALGERQAAEATQLDEFGEFGLLDR